MIFLNKLYFARKSYLGAFAALILVFLFLTRGSSSEKPMESINLNQPDDIVDPTFNPSIGFAGRILGAARQSEGKMVFAGVFSSVNGHQQINVARILENGAYDPTFVPPILLDSISELALQPDGKVLLGFFGLAGDGLTRGRIIRLNQDGSLDSSFNTGLGTSGAAIRCIYVLSDGDILVGGEFASYNGFNRHSMIRLNPDGSVDESFIAETSDFGDAVISIAESTDGKIFVAGRFTHIGTVERYGLAKLEQDGTVIQSFNAGLASSGTINEVLLQADGKILLGGRFNPIQTSLVHAARYNSDGTLDGTFTADNRVNNWVDGIGLHPDGKLFVYGRFFNSITGAEKMIYLLNSNGSIDESFSVETLKGQSSIAEAFVRNDGKILLAGEFPKINGTAHASLARLNPDSAVDETYTPYLVRKTLLSPDTIATLEFQPGGKILVGGTFMQVNDKPLASLARLNANGTLDASFNQTDVLSSNNEDLPVTVRAFAFQADGKILMVGNFLSVGGAARKYVARLNADGTLDASFNTGFGPNWDVYSVAVQPDGKILIGGQFDFINGVNRKYVARLNPDGTVDESFNIGTLVNSGNPTKIIVQPDGKILVSGVRNTSDPQWRAVVRLNQDGTRDTAFNPVINATAPNIELQPDGKIFVGGVFSTVNGQSKAGLARLNADGSLDPTFTGELASTGIATVDLQSDGRYLVGGSFTQAQSNIRAGMARFDSSGLLDTDLFAGDTQNGSIRKIYSGPGGKTIVYGTFSVFNNVPKLGIVQFGTSPQTLFDFDGDGRTDISIFRPSLGEWWYLRSSDGGNYAAQFGASTDKLTPGDFTGDGKTDIAFWRPSTGEWFVLRSEDSSYYSYPFGTNGDIPAVGDFDADGKADTAVFRPSNATWFIRRSSDGGATIQQFGANGDVPVVADYDGDSRADIAIYRPSVGEWWINRSTAGVIAFQFGSSSDKPTQGDFTGDGKADAAFWRPATGEWFVLRSEDFSYYSFPFGVSTDVPSPGDYDGDGKFDAAVFRPAGSTWYVQRSTAGTLIQSFGQSGDVPVPSAFIP